MSRFANLKQPAVIEDDEAGSKASNITSREDLTASMEEETRISAEYFEAYLATRGLLNIDPNCGVLFAGSNTNIDRRYLHITALKKATPFRIIRPQFCRQVLRTGTFTQLLHKLKCTPGLITRDRFPFGSEQVRNNVKVAFTADRFSNESDFSSSIAELMGLICGKCISAKNEVIDINTKRALPFIAWGLIPMKSEIPGEINVQTGCLGYSGSTLFSNGKPFAVFEFKNLNALISYTKPWYTLDNTWLLQVFNSFVGSDAAIAGALCPGGFFLIWREEIESEEAEDGSEGLKTYKYYSLDSFKLIEVTDENAGQLADVFVELVRICSAKHVFSPEKISARPSQGVSPRNSASIISPKAKIAKLIREKEGMKKSLIMLADGLGVLPVASLNPSEFFSEEELEAMAEDEKQRKREELEWVEVESKEFYESG
jgi:hypothetical protein